MPGSIVGTPLGRGLGVASAGFLIGRLFHSAGG